MLLHRLSLLRVTKDKGRRKNFATSSSGGGTSGSSGGGAVRVLRSSLFSPLQRVSHDVTPRSHQLLLQSGYLAKSSSGIFSVLPLGLRVVDKLNKLIDQELQRLGCQKVQLPSLVPEELWQRSGRAQSAGPEVFHVSDRKQGHYLLAPTHEEVVTELVAQLVSSYKELPLRLYQTTTKFRDEARPRHGLLRGREFIMNDLYSFDNTQEDAFITYEAVKEAYHRVLDKLEVDYIAAEADTGTIGGSKSHEFHIPSPIGEDLLLQCSNCNYASNVERAKSRKYPDHPEELVAKIDVQQLLGNPALTVEIFEGVKGKKANLVVAFCKRAEDFNTFKIKARLGFDIVKQWKREDEPQIDSGEIYICVDDSIEGVSEQQEQIMTETQTENRNQMRALIGSFQIADIVAGDFRQVQAAEDCPNCEKGALQKLNGIEVGHIFYLGTKYSEPLGAVIQNAEGKTNPIEMGCYGLGVTRIMASVLEVKCDDSGIVWPLSIAPYKAIVIPLFEKDDAVLQKSYELYDSLARGPLKGEIVFEDRSERPGFKMNDARFWGFPYSIVLGKGVLEGKVELQVRKTNEKLLLSEEELLNFFALL